ncbi:hypothetical protein [Algisphaera agarilytica]|uniref:Prefoldin subunit 5 n=1 Tax=Algisphaera agarilytica TaxID=1385975 RepID=A0A7X0H4S3_9BACT|nr:hypothetical protein [Algisphaera agarilytica]MBB6429282.1 prefoldin subunit 5 [Algisphaera agarilytica]
MSRYPGPALPRESLKRNLSPETASLVDSIAPNLDNAVSEVVDTFRKQLESQAEDFAQTHYVERFQHQISEIQTRFQANLDAADQEVRRLRETINTLTDTTKKDHTVSDLNNAIESLNRSATALDNKINEARQRAETLGNETGKVAATAIKLGIRTLGVPI